MRKERTKAEYKNYLLQYAIVNVSKGYEGLGKLVT